MAENGENSLLNFSPDDEDFVSCHICLNNFDENERVPKYLDCFHFFCLPCIKSLTNSRGRKKFLCPTCRVASTFTKAKFDDMPTNHVALRLLKVVTKVETDKVAKESQQQWCLECTAPCSANCLQNNHKLQNLIDFQNSCMLKLNSKVNHQNLACDEAQEDYRNVQFAHQVILAWIRWLQLEITHRSRSNDCSIARLESFKTPEIFHIPENEDMRVTVCRMEKLIEQSDVTLKEVQAAQLKARELLNTYNAAQLACTQSASRESPPNLCNWFKLLDTVPSDTSPTSANETCVKILLFLASLLNVEQPRGVHTKFIEILPKTVVSNVIDAEPMPSCSGTQQSIKRPASKVLNLSLSKRVRPSPSPPAPKEVNVVNAGGSNSTDKGETFCYFDISVGTEVCHVVFSINNKVAPTMSSKFIEFCLGETQPGYLGSEVVPVQTAETDTEPPQVHSLMGGKIIDYENLLFIADVSPLPAKKGCLLFIVKEANTWGTLVSPEFQILLGEPPAKDENNTTVFGYVATNLSKLTDLFRNLQTDEFIHISDCGVV